MITQPSALKICRPDDWHVHLRDKNILRTVLPYTSRNFGRAIIMPNLIPPITTLDQAISYRERILAALPLNHSFIPLMTCYLTDSTKKQVLVEGHSRKIFTAAKLYPAHVTTNSKHGIININTIYPLLEVMQNIGMPLLIHGEVTDHNIDIFDREIRFIEQVIPSIRKQFPSLKIVLEHITTKEAAEYVLAGDHFLGATITPHHLMFNRNHMLYEGIRPHLYCLPILKRNEHQQALRAAVGSGCKRIFLGTDTAPHERRTKESDCGCAGAFNAPSALSIYLTVFEEIGALRHFENFCSFNGPRFYGLPFNNDYITIKRETYKQPKYISIIGDEINNLVLLPLNQTLNWKVIEE